MDIERISSSTTILDMGITNDRPICIGNEQQSTDFLCMVSNPESVCNRRAVDSLELHDSVCVPTIMSDTESSRAHVTVSVPDNSDSTPVAQTTLVHTSIGKANRLSKKTSRTGKSSKSAQKSDCSSQSKHFQSDGMAALNRNFKNRGFSSQTRDLLSASWRAGTQRDYIGKFEKFNSWCRERQKDPYTATLVDCASFLTHLFHLGLQYRTIAGYRSMLSSVLTPIDNTPVGQHPYIIRLLKGVFNSRPPVVKLSPEWDLQKVLDMLVKAPFEPLKDADLKWLTFKTVFLVAITTFRRCADLQALRLGEGAVKVQNRGVTFIRCGLSKQARPGHMGSKIFIPCFKDNKKLDPKKSIVLLHEKDRQSKIAG